MNQLPLDDVNDLTSMPGFKELEERKEAFVYTAGEVVIYKNIYHEGAYVGRLSLLIEEGQSEEKTEYEKAVFNHLAGYVEQLYDQCGGFELGSPRLADLHHMMKNVWRQTGRTRASFCAFCGLTKICRETFTICSPSVRISFKEERHII